MYYNLLCIFYLDTVDGNIQITSFNLRNTQYIILHAQLRDPDCLAKQSSDAADRQTVKMGSMVGLTVPGTRIFDGLPNSDGILSIL